MPAATRTGQQVLDELSDLIEDFFHSAATSNGASNGTTLVDTELNEVGLDALRGRYVRVTSGSASGEVLRITGNTGSTLTVSVAASVQLLSAVTYEIHKYDPAAKFRAIDRAMNFGFPALSRVVLDATLTGDGRITEFPLPSTVRTGPFIVREETPLEGDPSWSYLADGLHNTLSGNWSLSAGTRSLVLSNDTLDRMVPKHDNAATRVLVPDSTAVAYSQVVAAMALTADESAGRLMQLGIWVYCQLPSRVTVRIVDDNATVNSAAHQGRGWEFLTVESDIVGNNTTLLTVSCQVTSGDPLMFALSRSYFVFGQIPNFYAIEHATPRRRRDATTQTLILDNPPGIHHNLQIEGRGLLTPLGGSSSATTEVDDETLALLAAQAAQELFRGLGVAVDDGSPLAQKLSSANQLMRELDNEFAAELSREPTLEGPWF